MKTLNTNKLIIIWIIIGVLSVGFMQAQAPQKMSYQAVIRDGSGELVTNSNIGIQVSILQGIPGGTAVYVERNFPTTNENGLVSLEIGNGTVVSGSFEDINWAEGPYFIYTETDLQGGSNYMLSHTSELLSVPYALHAQTAADLSYEIEENQALADVLLIGNDANETQIKNLGEPTDSKDAATKACVDLLQDQIDFLLVRIELLENSLGIGHVIDIDGHVYKTVIIGNQEWMAENLRVSKYNNGVAIPKGLSDAEWGNTTEGAYAVYPHGSIDGLDSDAEVVAAYGKLYNWFAVDDERGLCPAGWSVPSDDDWTQLVDYLAAKGYPNEPGNPNGAGNALKSCRQVDSPLGGECNTSTHPRWNSHYIHHGFDEFGFSALPGGYRTTGGSFLYLGSLGLWWSSTEYSSSLAWYRLMYHYFGNVLPFDYSKAGGFSLRCVRDLD